MFQSVLMFQAPTNPSQATLVSPPAVARPAEPLVHRRNKIRFGLSVMGNAIGCGAWFATCWFSLQLMQLAFT